MGPGCGSCSRSVTSWSWPTTALRRSPPPHWASHCRNIAVVDSSRSSSGPESREGLRAAASDSGSPGPLAGAGTSQRCIGSISAGPAASASELPRKPRRASIRSLRENSLSRATVCGPAQGRSTPATEGDWCAVRSPRSSTATTAPKRSENSSERMRGIGSRGCSPSSQRRTREVSVLMWWAPICRARRFTWRASSPLDQPLRTNHDPNCPLGRLPASVSPAPLPLTGTPPFPIIPVESFIARTTIRMPCIGAVRTGVADDRTGNRVARGIPVAAHSPRARVPTVILRSPL